MHIFNKRNKKLYSLLILFVVIFIILININQENEDLLPQKIVSKKFILRWNNYFWGRKLCESGFEICNSCVVTSDKNLMPVEDFDAIIFHDPWNVDESPPERRKFFQKYIFFSLESPIHYGYTYLNNFYNWTMNYRRDSDIYLPFGNIRNRPKKIELNEVVSVDQILNKSKLVAWINNHCMTKNDATSLRSLVASQLNYQIPIDIYGKCGIYDCPNESSLQCLKMLDNHYKFYLSFELFLCKDYITERLFNVLKHTNMVPIVFGLPEYKWYFPDKIFINMDDYSIEELADYLIFLDKNDEEYLKYFEWKKYFEVDDQVEEEACCELCKRLHEPLVNKWYDNFEEWALGKDSTMCFQYE